MTTEDNRPVYTLAPHAPWREILRQRLSGRRDRALVLRDREGAHHVLGTRRPRGAERVLWWVHDPAQAVRSRTAYGWDLVRKNLDRCLHQLDEAQTTAGRSFGGGDRLAGGDGRPARQADPAGTAGALRTAA
jgi:hypothetical protein